MKKRIKRKIGNRIMKNVMDGRPLSKFDKKYLYAMNKPIIEKLKLNVDKAFIKGEGKGEPVGLLSELKRELVETETVEVFAANQLFKAYKIEPTFSISEKGAIRSCEPEEHGHTYDSLRYVTEVTDKIPVVTRVEERSKWQKVKTKVRGWLGK